MKNTIKVLGIIALLAIIGFSMAACGDDDGGGGGGGGGGGSNSLAGTTWNNPSYGGVRFYTTSYDFGGVASGTYTFDGKRGSCKQNNTRGTANFTVNGNTMTFVSSSANSIPSGTYTKVR